MNILNFNHLGQISNDELPKPGQMVQFAKTPHLKGQWEFTGYSEFGMTLAADFICRVAGHLAYKVGHHMSQTVALLD